MNDQEYRRVNTSIAWFKLAELVIRREREKALNVYRLLFHSLENKAYALQLEGDLLWFFDDQLCVKKYQEAAALYEASRRWIDALALYEQMYLYDQSSVSAEVFLRAAALAGHEKKTQAAFARLKEQLDEGGITEQAFYTSCAQLADFFHDHQEKKAFFAWLLQQVQGSYNLLPESLQKELALIFYE